MTLADHSQDAQSAWVPEPGTILDGRYRLGRMVDRGGMGVIMSAEHLAMRREVAVKLLSPAVAGEQGYRARFRREVDLAAQLEHPNIVRCYDFGETDDGILYLVMEMLGGESLAAALKREGRFALDRAAALMTQLADGLSEAHLQDMVHRDLKPGNIYLVRDVRGRETVKLLDFGLARLVSSDDARITKTGKICGTVSYLPPEMLLTQENTTAGDVYACGLIMLEMLLGRKVFSSWSTTQTFLQQLTLPARIPRRVYDTAYGQLIARCLRKHPGERPQNADVMYRELTEMGVLENLRLDDRELPPAFNEDLVDSLIDDFNVGRIKTLEALRMLPEPEAFDADGPPIDETTTQRIVMSDIDAFLAAHSDEKQTIQLTTSERRQLRAGRSLPVEPARPAPRADVPSDVSHAGRPILRRALIACIALAGATALFAVLTPQEPQPELDPAPASVVEAEFHEPTPAAAPPADARPAAVVKRDVGVLDAGANGTPDLGTDSPRQPPARKRKRVQKPTEPKVTETPTPKTAETKPAPNTDAILDKYLKVGKPK